MPTKWPDRLVRLRGKVAITTMAGIVAAGVPAQALAATMPSIDSGVAVDGPTIGDHHDVLGTWVPSDLLGDAFVVVTPGTDDDGVFPRNNGLVGDRQSKIVQYPQSFGPFIGGRSGHLVPFFAPSYDESRDIAVDRNLQIMEAFQNADRVVVFTGFSQGAEALGNAAEIAADRGLPGENTLVLLMSDPRSPWGIKSGLQDLPFSAPVMASLGAESNGARDPGRTGDTKVVQVVVKGDPVAGWQWDSVRPVSSLLVNGAGSLVIHAGTGKYSYVHLENLDHEATYYSKNGNTTYEVYDTYHPFALLQYTIADAMGIEVSDATMREWDRQAERFYPTQDLTPETADPNAPMVRDIPQGRHRLLDDSGQWAAPDAGNARHRAPAHAAPDDSVEVSTVVSGDDSGEGETDAGSSDVAPVDTAPVDEAVPEDSADVADQAPVDAPADVPQDDEGSAPVDQ